MIIINLIKDINIDNIISVSEEIKKYLENTQRKQVEIENSINFDRKSHEFIVDRFEGEFAVCESINDNKVINVKRENLPVNVKEGNVLKYDGKKYVIDFNLTNNLKKYIKTQINNLWEN